VLGFSRAEFNVLREYAEWNIRLPNVSTKTAVAIFRAEVCAGSHCPVREPYRSFQSPPKVLTLKKAAATLT
jgi:hypothetical protein